MAAAAGEAEDDVIMMINHNNHDDDNDDDGDNGFDDEDELTTTSSGLTSEAKLAKLEFLVSFLVDARGGTMTGCRHSGLRVIIPARTAPQPMRITCRYIKEENLLFPPPLNEGEGLACRVLKVGPRGSKFLGPVLIEVPHVASLRNGEREVFVLRCDNGRKWYPHSIDDLEAEKEKVLKAALLVEAMSMSSPEPDQLQQQADMVSISAISRYGSSVLLEYPPAPVRNSDQLFHIVTRDFPQYFAILTRSRQEVRVVGPEGSVLNSPINPRAQVLFPPKALTRDTKVGLCVRTIEDELVEEIMVQGGAVSPVITIEPRRRKFHKPITVTMPLPERSPSYKPRTNRQNGGLVASSTVATSRTSIATTITTGYGRGGMQRSSVCPSTVAEEEEEEDEGPSATMSDIEMSLKLVCSMSGNHTKALWEDVTDSTPLTFCNGCVRFSSIVSASFWLVNIPKWMSADALSLVDQLYKNTNHVPYWTRFHVYARRHSEDEIQVRILLLTEADRSVNPLELQEDFKEVARSEYIEVLEKTEISVAFSGNLIKTETECPDWRRTFTPFRDNRQGFVVKRRKENNPYCKGVISFKSELDHILLFESKLDLSRFL